jgi:hypothetical protein
VHISIVRPAASPILGGLISTILAHRSASVYELSVGLMWATLSIRIVTISTGLRTFFVHFLVLPQSIAAGRLSSLVATSIRVHTILWTGVTVWARALRSSA